MRPRPEPQQTAATVARLAAATEKVGVLKAECAAKEADRSAHEQARAEAERALAAERRQGDAWVLPAQGYLLTS